MIIPETLERIASVAAASAMNEAALQELRQRWPDLRFTLCSDDDMPSRMKPVVQRERVNLYLVGGGEHCLSLTDDPMRAIGVVLALVDEE